MTEPQTNQAQPVFQTPNPEELKQAAQDDPIQERAGAEAIETADAPVADSEQIGREISAEMANSQAAIANLGGH
jgi:hypothetical protein